MDKDKFFEIIKNVHEKHGYINRRILKEEVKGFNLDWELSKYRGLKNICKELNLAYRQYSKLDSNEILQDALSVFMTYNRLSMEVYEQYGKFSKSTIKTHFGTFNNLLKRLNLPINMSRMVSVDEVVQDFEEFYKIHHTTSSTTYRKHGSYSQSVIDRLFGSWNNFIKYVGCEPICEKIGAQQMITDVKAVYDEYGYLSAKLINDNCSFSYQALRYHLNKEDISKAVGSDNAFANYMKRKSSGAKMLYNILIDIYGVDNIVSEYYEDWLRNPITGKIMYVDYYIKSEKIAVEYDGKQHYEFIEFIHRSYKNFFYQVYRDRIKEKKLRQHGIRIIRFKYDDILTEVEVRNKIENA